MEFICFCVKTDFWNRIFTTMPLDYSSVASIFTMLILITSFGVRNR